ncbi:MAG: right-handed parallel beta-helix repeat-containing protein [Phycisphaerales bacterium]
MITLTRKIQFIAIPTLLISAAWLSAGPLNPPAGPITSTGKTLTEVEPRVAINSTNTPGDADSLFKITQPGSYYLTANITGVVGKHGIEIAASGVTLDLNGLSLQGVAGSLDGISVTVSNASGIAISNGTIRAWGGDGVDLRTVVTNATRVERVSSITNAGTGIGTYNNATIIDCNAFNNSGSGFVLERHCTITSCTAGTNSLQGISANRGCTITNCTASNNLQNGILASTGCAITNCTAYANTLNGIVGSHECVLTSCVAAANGADGLSAGGDALISGCVATENGGDGIEVGVSCTVRGNHAGSNGSILADSAGIHTLSTDNRIEGNICLFNLRGVSVSSAGNFIVRNNCSNNTTNWVIAANNLIGPIMDRSSFSSPAVNGNAADSTLITSDPHANFTY